MRLFGKQTSKLLSMRCHEKDQGRWTATFGSPVIVATLERVFDVIASTGY